MEALDKALEREHRKLNPEVAKPVIVYTMDDIKRVVAEFDPVKNPAQVQIPLNTLLEANEDGKRNVYQVTANTKSKSKRDMLVEGLTIILNRKEVAADPKNATGIVEVNGQPMKAIALDSSTQGRSWVDPLIGQWTGGAREGTLIVWELEDGYKYKYDIFTHRLSRVSRS